MKKGEIKKQEILTAAEEMFCRYGYAETSVQDIIDRLHTSKGSFYHHFPSKEALVESICASRAGQIYHTAAAECEKIESPVICLDKLISGMIPFSGEKLSFLLMLLPVFMLPEGRVVRQSYCDALTEYFSPAVCHMIEKGHDSGEIFCDDPENAAGVILSIVNIFWTKISDMMILAEENRNTPDLTDFLHTADSCRICIERFLCLPFGSVSLIDIPTLKNVSDKIHSHWRVKKQ